MLLPALAEKIINEVRKLIGEDIIVVNIEGIIIASTDFKRVGTFHEGAFIALQKKKKLIITEEDQMKLTGVKAGINFPIFFQNDVIGIIGITGDPSKVTPFGEIIRKMTELLLIGFYQRSGLQATARKIGFLGILPDHLALMEKVLPEVATMKELKNRPVHVDPIGKQTHRVAFFSGCLMDSMFMKTNDSTIKLL